MINYNMPVLFIITILKRSCGKIMFSQAYVKNSVHGGGSARHPLAGRHPVPGQILQWADIPPGRQTAPWADPPPWANTPVGKHPPSNRAPWVDPPPPKQTATAVDGWLYASYCNAFLLTIFICQLQIHRCRASVAERMQDFGGGGTPGAGLRQPTILPKTA